jgi:hypothetical protein
MGSQGSSRRIFSRISRVLRMIRARSGAGLVPVSQGFGTETPLIPRLRTEPSCLPLSCLAGIGVPRVLFYHSKRRPCVSSSIERFRGSGLIRHIENARTPHQEGEQTGWTIRLPGMMATEATSPLAAGKHLGRPVPGCRARLRRATPDAVSEYHIRAQETGGDPGSTGILGGKLLPLSPVCAARPPAGPDGTRSTVSQDTFVTVG